ncbi:MAG: MATE family efflux transporter [Muribaculaceae bacterium]|nr:MATE family efflux transporter [Muribaculaceae bacterium]
MDRINREIVRLSIPTVVSNITIPLLGICDTAISGHLGSELFLSAIAVGSVMLNVVFWIFGFLRGGTTGLTANALGAGSMLDISKVFYRSLLIAGSAGFLLIIFQRPVFNVLWWIAGSGEEIKQNVLDYFTIRIWGAPALLAIIAVSGWFVGMQNTYYPMLIAILTNVINIGSSCLLVYGFNSGFNGVAMGTLISNWSGLVIALVCVLWFLRGKIIRCSFRNLIQGEWLRYFSVNGNLFLRSLLIICVTMGVTAFGARISTLTLAVNVIVMQFFQFFSFFMDGFAYSAEAMVGLKAGERDFPMLKQYTSRLLKWTLGTGITFSLLYFFGLDLFTSLLAESLNVREGVGSLTIWISLIPIVSCWTFIYDGFYIGITDTFRMMFSTFISALIFFGILFFNYFDGGGLSLETGNYIIWTAFLSYLLLRGVYLAWAWPHALLRVSDGVSPNCSR